MKEKNIKILIVLISLIVFLISLTQTAIIIKGSHYDYTFNYSENHPVPAFYYFIFGIMSGNFEELIWFANPLYFFSIVMFLSNKKKAIILSVIALILAVSFSFWNNIIEVSGGGSRRVTKILSFELGYYLWVISIAILNLGIYLIYENKKTTENPNLYEKNN